MQEIKRDTGDVVKIFAKTIENEAFQQIKKMANFEAYVGSKIRIMPDCHAGVGCTVGTTMTISDKITPGMVGVDIGCGMLTIKLKQNIISHKDLEKLDEVINNNIPSGFNVNDLPTTKFDYSNIRCTKHVDIPRGAQSLGTLGGGNHFIELSISSKGEYYLIIHSGSRNLGNQVARYYQNLAWKNVNEMKTVRENVIKKLKADGKSEQIAAELKKIQKPPADKELAYLTGNDYNDYMHDMEIIQKYAVANRRAIADSILKHMGWAEYSNFETIHNYIDFNRRILRKGAVSAEKGEVLLIPINMRDGSLICVGKGNEDWNFSAPHGAGRLLSRSKAKEFIDLEDFQNQMKEIYTTSVGQSTLDEAPDAYKSMNEIKECIIDTVDIIETLKPVYNFKAH